MRKCDKKDIQEKHSDHGGAGMTEWIIEIQQVLKEGGNLHEIHRGILAAQ